MTMAWIGPGKEQPAQEPNNHRTEKRSFEAGAD